MQVSQQSEAVGLPSEQPSKTEEGRPRAFRDTCLAHLLRPGVGRE